MNISNTRIVKISKYLSYHLRHLPGLLGLELASGGWVKVERLIASAHENQFSLTLSELKTVVDCSDKKRFSADRNGKLIRANRGHSIAIDLQLPPQQPTGIL